MKRSFILVCSVLLTLQFSYAQFSEQGSKDLSFGLGSLSLSLKNSSNTSAEAYADYVINSFLNNVGNDLPTTVTFTYTSNASGTLKTSQITIDIEDMLNDVIANANSNKEAAILDMQAIIDWLSTAEIYSNQYSSTDPNYLSGQQAIFNSWAQPIINELNAIIAFNKQQGVGESYWEYPRNLVSGSAIPLDGGLSFLLAGGGLYAINRLRKKK